MKAKIDYGVPVEHLPTVSWDDFKRRCTQGEKLTVVFNIVHDVSEFIADHPVRNISVFIIQGRYYRLSNSKIKMPQPRVGFDAWDRPIGQIIQLRPVCFLWQIRHHSVIKFMHLGDFAA
jgi:hypothetical protein